MKGAGLAQDRMHMTKREKLSLIPRVLACSWRIT